MPDPWLLAIDPGPTESAWLEYHDGALMGFAKEPNEVVLNRITLSSAHRLAIEMVASYGMPVGAEVFETCVWAGRFTQRWIDAWPHDPPEVRDVHVLRLFRKNIKRHLCGTTTAKDGNIRQALIDRFGPGKELAIGLKKSPGPLYGVSKDVWSALAVAVTASDELATVRSLP